MGGMIVLNGAWDSLYPIPDPNSHVNPGIAADSTMRPRYRGLAIGSGANGLTAFIQPPPAALMLAPLALLSYEDARFVWLLLLCLAAWGTALEAAKIYDLCVADSPAGKSERDQRLGGLLILLICISPLTYCCVRSGNISAIIGWLIGVATASLIRRSGGGSEAGGVAAILIAGVQKYASFVLVPLYVAMRRWRALIELSIMGLALLALSVVIMGAEPFRTFIGEIAPTLGRSVGTRYNMSLPGLMLRMGRRETLSSPQNMAIHYAGLVVLALILVLMFSRPRRYWDSAIHVAGAAAALLCWLLVFSPIAWLAYFMYLVPLSGWLIVQARRSVAGSAVVIVIIAMCYVPLQMFPRFNPPEPVFSYPLLSLILMLGLSIRTMLPENDRAAA